jgi:DNA-binding FadR family transcriptional regulator
VNRTEHHIEGLKKLKSICLNPKAFKKPKDVMEIDIQMRKILYDATKSPILVQITELLYCQTFRLWLMLFDKLGIKRELQVQIEELDHYIKVLSDQDADGAESIGVMLFDNYIERLNVYFSTF